MRPGTSGLPCLANHFHREGELPKARGRDFSLITFGIYGAPRVPIRGGNSNNGAIDGASAVNLNNDASNANWNIGASLSYSFIRNNH